ncbi:Crp/Fnr family transcriptional regulator [Tropicimonas sp. S265A]|uniref:Crp/Fnr family transcriptional regulator n=1 Tax=Tropicimonas sp. S265A TaxID=3415134 RepID=UPI003C7A2DFF
MAHSESDKAGYDAGFLALASPRLRNMLETLATPVRLAAGEVLFTEGDAGDALFAVSTGAIEVSVLSPDGRKLLLDVMREGELLGEIALFDPGERTATVTALEPTTLRRVAHSDLLAALQATPDLAADLLRLAGRRMRAMTLQIEDQVFLPLASRLARKLLYLTTSQPEARLEMSQAQLGEFVGATREAVSKILGEWRRAGVVELSRAGVLITDRAALKLIADPASI